MFLLLPIAIGVLLLCAARTETRQSWYAPTHAGAAAHAKRARVYRITGRIVIGLAIAIPVAFVVLLWLFMPTFTF